MDTLDGPSVRPSVSGTIIFKINSKRRRRKETHTYHMNKIDKDCRKELNS